MRNVAMIVVMGWLCFASSVGALEQQFKDPGFEGRFTEDAWLASADNAADARVELDRVEPVESQQSLLITLDAKPAAPVVVGQTLVFPEDASLPSLLTFLHRVSRANMARAVVRYSADGVAWTDQVAPLGVSPVNWRRESIALQFPEGARHLRVEFHVADAGRAGFDDVRLDYTPPAEGPDTLLLVGIAPHMRLDDLNDLLYDHLRANGWRRIRGVTYDQLTKAELERARLVMLFAGETTLGLDPHERAMKEALVEYVRAGGGLIITQDLTQQLSRMWFRMELMKDLGGEILLEIPNYGEKALTKVGEYGDDQFAYTDRVHAPLNDGVDRLLLQGVTHYGAMHSLLPFLPTEDWKVVVSTPPDVGTTPFANYMPLGLAFYEGLCRPEGFKGETPVVGIREFGKGRVAYYGIQSFFFYRDFTAPAVRVVAEAILEKGLPGGEPVQGLRFLENLFNWTSAKSPELDVAAIPSLTTRAGYEQDLGGDSQWFRGVIGPRTTYSTGKSTPAEYVAKAKEIGLNYLVFLEDFAAIDADGYEALRAECAALSDKQFTAIPGLTYRNEFGNDQYIFSFEPIFPGKKFLKEVDGQRRFMGINPAADNAPGDLEYTYTMLGFNNNVGWYNFKTSPYALTDMRTVQSMAVLTQEDGKTVEEAFDVYEFNNRDGQVLIPQALVLAKSAAELDLVADGTYYTNVVNIDGVAKFRRFLMIHGGSHKYPGEPSYGNIGVTNGPEIFFDMPRGDMDPRTPYNPVLNHWPYDIRVTSPAGIDRVEMIDSDTVIRTWRPGGEKVFKTEGVITNDRQRYLWLRAYATDGTMAFTRSINSNSFLLRENQCNDRMNQLLYSSQARPNPDDPPFLSGYGADTCTPDKGPWNGRIRPVGFFVFDEKLGISAKGLYDGSPEDHPQMGMIPTIAYNGVPGKWIGWQLQLVTDLEGGLHNIPRRIVASSNALVGDRVLDSVFDLKHKPVIHVWHTMYPLAGPSKFVDTFGRCTLFLPKVDGIVPYLWEQDLKILQDIPTGGSPAIVRVGGSRGSSNLEAVVARVGGAMLEGDQRHATFDFNPGDFVVYIDRKFGSLAVFPLSEAMRFEGGGLTVKTPGDTLAADTVLNVRVLGVGIHKFDGDGDPVAVARRIVDGYGLADGKPTYRFDLDQGQITRQQFTLELTAVDDAVSGRLAGVADLPGNLGARITNLRDTWSAVVASADRIRVVPVEQGMGYVALTADEDGPLFIGHPFVTDADGLVLAVAQRADRKTWELEIHNPTEQIVTARVTNHPRFGLLKLDETFAVPAGASIIVAPEAAAK